MGQNQGIFKCFNIAFENLEIPIISSGPRKFHSNSVSRWVQLFFNELLLYGPMVDLYPPPVK